LVIKAVFFDLYHTLVGYDPPREELEAKTLGDLGIQVPPEALRRPLVAADEFIYQEHSRLPFSQRSDEEKKALYARYQAIVLKEAGIEATQELIMAVLGRMMRHETKLVLFDDVMPALTQLKEQGLILGLISNVDRDIAPLCQELGISSLLQVVVTSQHVGVNKPKPGIFLEALRQAGVEASESMYVGDQYQVDVVGANQAGMKGVLLDRSGYYEGIGDSPRIRSLDEVVEHL